MTNFLLGVIIVVLLYRFEYLGPILGVVLGIVIFACIYDAFIAALKYIDSCLP